LGKSTVCCRCLFVRVISIMSKDHQDKDSFIAQI
jgi:hypothetical protein